MQWNLDKERFSEDLLRYWVDKGFGSASKKDLETYGLHLLIQGGQYTFPRDFFLASRELKITESRLRTLYQNMQLLHGTYTQANARQDWAKLVQDGQFELNGERKDRITFIVREPMLRQYLEEWVAAVNGFTDTSFNRSLVVMGVSTLERVLDHLVAGREVTLPAGYSRAKAEAAKTGKSLTKHFVEEFVKAAGQSLGTESMGIVAKVFAAFVMT